jgi:hypothetical protein
MPFRVLLKAAGKFQTRGVYAPLRGVQTVTESALTYFPFRQLLRCSQMPMGKIKKIQPLKGAFKAALGLGIYNIFLVNKSPRTFLFKM